MTHGSLFAGIEGFGEGFRRAGFRTTWQVEKEPFCIAVLKTRFPNTERYYDVLKCGHDRTHKLRAVDVLTAGFPCQDLSVAGKRAGLAGSRSGLFWEVVRILGELRTPWFVLENVPGLFSSNGGEDFRVVLSALDELGYGLAWRVLDSQYFGVAQRRRRVFIVGCLGKPCPTEVLFESAGGGGDIAKGGEERADLAVPLARGTGVTGNAPGRRREDDFNLAIASSGERERAITGSCWKRHDEDTDTLVATLNSGGNDGGFRTEPGEHIVAYALRNDPGGTGQGHNTTYAIAAPLTASYGKQLDSSDTNGGPPNAIIGAPADPDRVRDFAELPEGLDSARYRALGNAVTASVAEWIGRRIIEAERLSL